MGRILKTYMMLLVVTCATGCATGYWTDRGRDSLDLVTATVGMGTGASVRVGPIGLGCMKSQDVFGLRGGAVGDFRGDHEANWLLILGEEYFTSQKSALRAKNYAALSWLMLPEDVRPAFDFDDFVGSIFGNCNGMDGEAFLYALAAVVITYAVIGSVTVSVEPCRHSIRSSSPMWNWVYLTQVEAAAGFGGAVRLGAHPGELIDFLLGWFGVDFMNDDIGCHPSGAITVSSRPISPLRLERPELPAG